LRLRGGEMLRKQFGERNCTKNMGEETKEEELECETLRVVCLILVGASGIKEKWHRAEFRQSFASKNRHFELQKKQRNPEIVCVARTGSVPTSYTYLHAM